MLWNHAWTSGTISILGKHIGNPNSVFVDEVIFFLNRSSKKLPRQRIRNFLLSIYRHHTKIKRTFLDSWEQTSSETHLFYSKISIRKFDLLWPGLTWLFSVVDLHGVKLQNGFDFFNSTCKGDHKAYAAFPIFFILVKWPFVTWPCLALTCN